jgi:hypothetical protein
MTISRVFFLVIIAFMPLGMIEARQISQWFSCRSDVVANPQITATKVINATTDFLKRNSFEDDCEFSPHGGILYESYKAIMQAELRKFSSIGQYSQFYRDIVHVIMSILYGPDKSLEILKKDEQKKQKAFDLFTQVVINLWLEAHQEEHIFELKRILVASTVAVDVIKATDIFLQQQSDRFFELQKSYENIMLPTRNLFLTVDDYCIFYKEIVYEICMALHHSGACLNHLISIDNAYKLESAFNLFSQVAKANWLTREFDPQVDLLPIISITAIASRIIEHVPFCVAHYNSCTMPCEYYKKIMRDGLARCRTMPDYINYYNAIVRKVIHILKVHGKFFDLFRNDAANKIFTCFTQAAQLVWHDSYECDIKLQPIDFLSEASACYELGS